jgi:hypothetical protein
MLNIGKFGIFTPYYMRFGKAAYFSYVCTVTFKAMRKRRIYRYDYAANGKLYPSFQAMKRDLYFNMIEGTSCIGYKLYCDAIEQIYRFNRVKGKLKCYTVISKQEKDLQIKIPF